MHHFLLKAHIFFIWFSVSSIPSYMIKAGYDSEEDSNANQYRFEDVVKRDKEVKLSVMQQMIETILKDAKLSEKEPISNGIDQINSEASCAVADESLKRLNKIYPAQQLAWPHILSKRSTILVGNTDYYPHLLYLPAVCELIKVWCNFNPILNYEIDADLFLNHTSIGSRIKTRKWMVQKLSFWSLYANGQGISAESVVVILMPFRPPRWYISTIPMIWTMWMYVSTTFFTFISFFQEISAKIVFFRTLTFKVEKYSQCKIFVSIAHHICIAANLKQYFPASVQCVVMNDFQIIPFEQRQTLIKILYSIKLPVNWF